MSSNTVNQRINFASTKNPLTYPDFLEVQLKSFQDFLQLDTPPEKRKKEGLYKVFAEKQSKIRVGEQFTITLKNKLGEMYGDPTLMGQRATDEEPSIPDQRSTTKNERGRSSRGGRDGLTREQMNDPNFSRNAPQQNGGVSSDNIVDAIRSSAKAAGAVEVDRESTDLSDERVRAIESVASKIVELEDLNTEASELGDDPLYDIDEVLEKLKDL